MHPGNESLLGIIHDLQLVKNKLQKLMSSNDASRPSRAHNLDFGSDVHVARVRVHIWNRCEINRATLGTTLIALLVLTSQPFNNARCVLQFRYVPARQWPSNCASKTTIN